jgi:hypothetical protein
MKRYSNICNQIANILEQNEKVYYCLQDDKLIFIFKGRSEQWIFIDICVLESTTNMRSTKNNHRRQNNQKHIGNAIDRLKETLHFNDKIQYIIYCEQLNENDPSDVDLFLFKQNIKINGACMISDVETLERIVRYS